MASSGVSPTGRNKEDIRGPGVGYVFLGTLGSDYNETEMEAVGFIKAPLVFNPIKETVAAEAGTPSVEMARFITKQGCELSFRSIEFNLKQFAKAIGMGTYSFEDSGTETISNEKALLVGRLNTKLMNMNISSVTVTSMDATPVVYTEKTDYTINETRGTIQRTDDSKIPDNTQVYVSYTATHSYKEVLKVGSQTELDYLPIKVMIPGRDNMYTIIKIWKAVSISSGEISLSESDVPVYEYKFRGIYDETADPDEAVYRIENEVSVNYGGV